jgi:hypothetical protein
MAVDNAFVQCFPVLNAQKIELCRKIDKFNNPIIKSEEVPKFTGASFDVATWIADMEAYLKFNNLPTGEYGVTENTSLFRMAKVDDAVYATLNTAMGKVAGTTVSIVRQPIGRWDPTDGGTDGQHFQNV